jgi:hypothetical protein
VKSWYFGLPWYFKILGMVVLVGLLLLWLLKTFWKDGTGGAHYGWADPKGLVDSATKDFRENDAAITEIIDAKKKEIATKLNQAGAIDQTTLDNRKKLEAATTMEELDKLQRELGL